MSITDRTAINMAVPAYKVDQIIGIKTGSFSIVAATVGSQEKFASAAFDTGFGDSCFFQGVFSTDSGASWNDFGVYRPNLTTPGQPVLQTVTCYGIVSPAGVFTAAGVNWWDNVHATSSVYTIQYKVAFLAKETQGFITPIPTSESLYYSSEFNYQKYLLSLASSFPSTTGSTPITHNLGYVPKVRAFFSPTSTSNNADGISITAGSIVTLDHYQYATNVYVNSTQATFTDISTTVSPRTTVNGTVFYRIYIDD